MVDVESPRARGLPAPRLPALALDRVDLVLLSRNEVRVNLHYMGELEQLSLALAQADLVLEEDEDDWILGRVIGVGTGR